MKRQNRDLKKCPSCKELQDARKKECHNCGHDLTDVSPITKETTKKSFFNIGCGVILVLMSLGALKVVLGNIEEPAAAIGAFIVFLIFLNAGIRVIKRKKRN